MTARRPCAWLRPGARRSTWTTWVSIVVLAAGSPAPAQDRVGVLAEPSATAVGVAVVIDVGGAWELEAEAGAAHLAARAALAQVRPALDALEAGARVTCAPAALVVTLVAPPGTWERAAGQLLGALVRPRLTDGVVRAARAELLDILTMEEASPGQTVRQALRRARYGQGHRWTRPACGQIATVAGLTPDEVRRAARGRFTASRMTAAVAGPVEPGAAREVLEAALGRTIRPSRPAEPPHARAGRVRVSAGTVTAWVELAFPVRFPPDDSDLARATQDEAVRVIASHLQELASPSVANPDVFLAAAEFERVGNGGALVVSLIVAPDRADWWAARIRAAVTELADRELPDLAFAQLVRRHRGARLLALAAPEARALDAAFQILYGQAHVPPARRIDRLTPRAVRTAAARLGEPAVAVVAPD